MKAEVIKIEHLQGLFFLWALTVLTSLLLFILEILRKSKHMKEQTVVFQMGTNDDAGVLRPLYHTDYGKEEYISMSEING